MLKQVEFRKLIKGILRVDNFDSFLSSLDGLKGKDNKGGGTTPQGMVINGVEASIKRSVGRPKKPDHLLAWPRKKGNKYVFCTFH